MPAYLFVDIDINNCHLQLIKTLLVEAMGKPDFEDEFPVWDAFLQRYRVWRTFLQRYLDIDLDTAKQELIRLFFLGMPRHDLPPLWAISVEV